MLLGIVLQLAWIMVTLIASAAVLILLLFFNQCKTQNRINLSHYGKHCHCFLVNPNPTPFAMRNVRQSRAVVGRRRSGDDPSAASAVCFLVKTFRSSVVSVNAKLLYDRISNSAFRVSMRIHRGVGKALLGSCADVCRMSAVRILLVYIPSCIVRLSSLQPLQSAARKGHCRKDNDDFKNK
jgi:hypothetical protein